MATGDEELRVPIKVPVDTNAGAAASSVKDLRDQIAASKDAIKQTAAALRDLRGNSDAVKAAKDQLKARLESQKKALSDSTLQLVKTGGAYKDMAKGASGASQAIAAAGGPLASISSKLESMTTILGGTEGGMAAAAGATALLVAGIAAVGAAAISGVYALGKWILLAADAARITHLTRKANLGGNDTWAKNLSEQVDDITRRVPVAREKVDDLAFALARSRIGGQTMVDTLNAVAGASAAVGDQLGNKLKGIVERGALTRRFQLSPQELLGMDLDFDDVAKAYASGMKISVEAARAALVEGRVRLQDGATALRKAVETKFGGINADRLLSLDNIVRKLREDFVGLAKDVNIEPILRGLKQLASNLDASTVNGKALRGIVTTIGQSLGISFQDGVSALQNFIDYSVFAALKFENYWLRAKLAFRDIFGPKVTLEATLFNTALSLIVDTLTRAVPALDGVVKAINALRTAYDAFKAGKAIPDGIGEGVDAGKVGLLDKLRNLAKDSKKAFDGPLEIASPSKAMFRSGKDGIDAGLEGGIEAGAPGVRDAMGKLVPGAPSVGGDRRGGGAVTIHYAPQIIVQGGAGADVRAQLRDPSLLQAMTDHFLAMLRAGGFEVPT